MRAVGKNDFGFSIYGEKGELHFDLENKLTGSFRENRGEVKEIDVKGVTRRRKTK